MQTGRRPLALGITGCIGAYKAPELLRRLQKKGFDVYPVLTGSALKFVTETTLETLSGHSAISSLWNPPGELDVKHISLSDKIEGLLVAPATANILAKFARGLADDFLSTLYISSDVPVIVAPAMNEKMWKHSATRENVEILSKRGVTFIEPDSGWLACGWEGQGRLADLDLIVERTLDTLNTDKYLAGKHVLISAGPTREEIDPMRFISNYSSGKMGIALANEARRAGASVTMVHGPICAEPSHGVKMIRVESAEQMHTQMMQESNFANIIIMSAAVADYKAATVSTEKLKKHQDELILKMTRTTDILTELSNQRGNKCIVGFAAETGDLRENALEKLEKKKLDLIVANSIAKGESVAGSDNTSGLIINRHGRERGVGRCSKEQMAAFIFEEIRTLLEN